MGSERKNKLLGGLAIQEQMVDADKVKEALIYQKKLKQVGKKPYRLGEILAMKKYLTADQVKELLKVQKKKLRDSIRLKQKDVQKNRLKRKSAVIKNKKSTDGAKTELDLKAATAAVRSGKAIDKKSARRPIGKPNQKLKKAVEGVEESSYFATQVIVWVVTAVISAIAIGYVL